MANPHPFFMLMCLLSLAFGASASPAFTPTLSKAYNESLKLRINSSRYELHKSALDKSADKAVMLLLANYNDFLELCVQQDVQRYEDLIEAQELRLDEISELKIDNAWRDYALAEVRMQVAMCKLLFGNRLSAAWDFRKAYLQYIQNQKQWSDFTPNKKNLGVLQVLIGSVPDQYQWFLNIIGLKGSIRTGMANLKAAAFQPNPFQDEAKLLYAVLLHTTDQEKASEAVKMVTTLADAQPDNLLFLFTSMHLLKKTNQGEAAIKLYEVRPKINQYLSFPYLHHLAADLYLYRGDYGKSIVENKNFLDQHRGQHYLKSAHYKIHLANLLNHRTSAAKQHFNLISTIGIAETEEDKYAASYAERNEQPVVPLLKARLHADGGYYQEALKDLAQLQLFPATPLPVRAEYLYRKARVLHGMEELESAVKFYKQTIALAASTDLYYAPNAAMQLGYIYQQANLHDQARAYFKQALNHKGHPYKNSIDAKAKLALSTL